MVWNLASKPSLVSALVEVMGLVWASERFFLFRCPPYLSAAFEEPLTTLVDYNIDLLLLSVLKLLAKLLGSYFPLFLWLLGVRTAFYSTDWEAAVVVQWSRSRSCRRACGTLLARLLFDVISITYASLLFVLLGASRVWLVMSLESLMGLYDV